MQQGCGWSECSRGEGGRIQLVVGLSECSRGVVGVSAGRDEGKVILLVMKLVKMWRLNSAGSIVDIEWCIVF